MLSRKHLISQKWIVILTVLCCAFALIPFRIITNSAQLLNLEMILKCFVIPGVLLIFCACMNTIKYFEQHKAYADDVTSFMSYFPLAYYFVALMISTLQVLTLKPNSYGALYGVIESNIIFIVIVAYIMILLVGLGRAKKRVATQNNISLISYDMVYAVLMILFAIMSFKIQQDTYKFYQVSEAYFKGNGFLLAIFVAGLVWLLATLRPMFKFINQNHYRLRVNYPYQDSKLPKGRLASVILVGVSLIVTFLIAIPGFIANPDYNLLPLKFFGGYGLLVALGIAIKILVLRKPIFNEKWSRMIATLPVFLSLVGSGLFVIFLTMGSVAYAVPIRLLIIAACVIVLILASVLASGLARINRNKKKAGIIIIDILYSLLIAGIIFGLFIIAKKELAGIRLFTSSKEQVYFVVMTFIAAAFAFILLYMQAQAKIKFELINVPTYFENALTKKEEMIEQAEEETVDNALETEASEDKKETEE